MEVNFVIDKSEVLKEIAQTTSYAGAKMDETDAYERIFTTDEDSSMLERFWQESKDVLCNNLKRLMINETERDGKYTIVIEPSVAYDVTLTDSITRSIFSFFVMSITAKWFGFTNKEEAAAYATASAVYIEDIMSKVYFKRKPVRPSYN